MDLSRRAVLVGAGAALLSPKALWAQSALEREHQARLDLPILSEDPTAVPVSVSVDHPMESDHFIRSIDITIDRDPVPHKGKFFFTPANGRAWVAFSMRSGAGGRARAVAECSRHGRFTATRELRVAEGGCTTGPDPAERERLGNPQLRLPRSLKAGDVVEIKARVDHPSQTGLALKNGKFVRESPEFYVKQMLVFLDEQKISEFQLTPALSANPLVRFPLRVARAATLRVVFVNSEDRRWEVSQPIRI